MNAATRAVIERLVKSLDSDIYSANECADAITDARKLCVTNFYP